MLDSGTLLKLYKNVLTDDIHKYNIPEENIRLGIQSMAKIYQPDSTSLKSTISNLADFNDAAHRCAYLHKFAAFHTSMVRDMMYEAVRMHLNFFYDIVFSSERLQICCLGGGPGTDVIGILAALHSAFSYFPTSVAVVDYMVNWSYSFRSILQELGSGFYGAFGNNVYHSLDWRYIGANLLQHSLSSEVDDVLSSASIVSMIKFTSATACVDTKHMIQNIFTTMKPGAVLLFIDNDGGGFHELIMKAAYEHDFLSIFGPIRHENYKNDAMKVKRFGYPSCCKTTVTVHVLQKPWFNNYDRRVVICDSPLLDVSLTPYSRGTALNPVTPLYRPPISLLQTPVSPDEFLGTFDFAQDNSCNDKNNNFSSPLLDIPQSPRLMPSYVRTPLTDNNINSPFGIENRPPAIYTPEGVRGGRKGCLPLKKLGKHFKRKFDNVKSRASSFFKRRPQVHPIFQL